MDNRIYRILLSAAAAVHLVLVAFNNLTDYASNLFFVQGVFSMEDIFSYPVNGWRAITTPVLHHAGYVIIILTETAAAVLLITGTVKMISGRRANDAVFTRGNDLTSKGLLVGLLLWFVAFIIVGGEWFLMWQSEKMNALPTAFNLAILYLLLLIFFMRPLSSAEAEHK